MLSTPLACTTTFPVVAPVGTVTAMVVALHVTIVAVVPLNFTVLVPGDDPKFVPVTVTAAPTAPVVIDRLVMLAGKAFPVAGGSSQATTTLRGAGWSRW